MQCLAPELGLDRLHPGVALARAAVEGVAEQRVPQLGEVDTDLVCAAGLEADLEQGGAAGDLDPSFGNGGKVTTEFFNFPESARAIARRFCGVTCSAVDPDTLVGLMLEIENRLWPRDAGAVEGAIFGLMGLLIAFTFSGAATRFEARLPCIFQLPATSFRLIRAPATHKSVEF